MTAKDLLRKVFDYQYLWALPQRLNSKPAMIRRAQIESLQMALGLSQKNFNSDLKSLSAIEYLVRGQFLLDRPMEQNSEIADRVAFTIRQISPHSFEEKTIDPGNIQWMFIDLLNFRFEIYKLTYPNSETVEVISPGLLYSQYLQHQIQEMIKNNLEEIDETLWILLDPERRTFSKQALVEDYAYPEEDLTKIDHEWRAGNQELNTNQTVKQKESNLLNSY